MWGVPAEFQGTEDTLGARRGAPGGRLRRVTPSGQSPVPDGRHAGTWFPDVRKAMGRNRLTELGEQMEKAKKKAPGEPLAVPSAKS